jgi:hypothetical protein
MTMTTNTTPAVDRLLAALADRARASGVFGPVEIQGGMLVCAAKESAEPAEYRVFVGEDGKLWVSLVTDNRWLSESIETDLVHTGDKLDELIEEEMVDLGYEGPRPTFEHFRSDDLLFTFRTRLPIDPARASEPAAVETGAVFLLGYEQCFRQLGDMAGGDDED